jgi:hypothetical protein
VVVVVISADRLPLPILEPVVARNPAVVFVNLAIARLPVVELARRNAQPGDESLRGDASSITPVTDVIDDSVTNVVGNPASV